jgi:hypothetical protein
MGYPVFYLNPVALAPGVAFGNQSSNDVRASLAVDDKMIVGGLERAGTVINTNASY